MPRGYAVVTEAIVQQLVFTLNLAWEIASRESPDYDLVVYYIQQAIQAAQEEASRQGTVVDFDRRSEIQ